ncbi:MAG: hypothetical protein ACUVYA_17475, partial [Planctomycetota bacterium]
MNQATRSQGDRSPSSRSAAGADPRALGPRGCVRVQRSASGARRPAGERPEEPWEDELGDAEWEVAEAADVSPAEH